MAAAEQGRGWIDTLRVMWRRKLLVLAVAALGTLAAAVLAVGLTPRFEATTQLIVDSGRVASVGGSAEALMRSRLGTDRTTLYNEVEVIRSPAVIGAVVRDLDLSRDPEFNTRLADPGLVGGMVAGLRAELAALWSAGAIGAPPPELRVMERFLADLTVRPAGVSRVINVGFRSNEPAKAARIANAVAQAYIDDQAAVRSETIRRSSQWLHSRVDELRAEVVEAEKRISTFQEKGGLAGQGQTSITDNQVVQTSQQLLLARSQRTERSARLDEVRRLTASSQAVDAAAEIRDSPVISRLRDEDSRLTRQAAELSTRFGERHPKMIKLQAEIADQRRKIQEEVQRIVQGLTNDVRLAEGRERMLEQNLEQLGAERARANRVTVSLQHLQREAEAKRKLYEELLTRLAQIKQEESLATSFVQILAPATVPLRAVEPKKELIVAFGLLISLVIGASLVLVLESKDTGFRSTDEIERLAHLTTFGAVPRLSASECKTPQSVPDLVIDSPGSAYVEAIRSLRTALSVTDPDKPPRIILVASTLPGEGKTSLAISLARLSALSALTGRVILIDCDLRRPSVGRMMGLPEGSGLLELFAGRAELANVVQIDPRTGLHVITAPAQTPNPPELLGSRHMRALVEQLSRSYETVIIDSPALSAAADARVLAHLADVTVFVVQWESTPRRAALNSLKQLMSAGADVAGIVLQKVNLRKLSKYGYGDAGVY